MNDDSLESLLRATNDCANPPPRLQSDLPDRVRRLCELRRQRRMRMRLAAAFSTCYLAGLLTMRVWMALATPNTIARTDAGEGPGQHGEASTVQPAEIDGPLDLDESPSRTSPDQRTASLNTSSYQQLRELGDKYLKHDGRIKEAIEMYRLALHAATEEELAVVTDEDSWLLVVLKKHRQKREST